MLKKDPNQKTKLMLRCDEQLWKLILKYKIDYNHSNNNKAVLELVRKGLLVSGKKEIAPIVTEILEGVEVGRKKS